MNSLDISIFLVCVISTLVGFVRGFIASLFGTFGWILAILINHYLFQSIEPFLEAKFHSKLMSFMVGYVGVLIVLLLTFSILNFIVVSAVQRLTVGYMDKVLGALFGLAHGLLLVIIGFLCFDVGTTILWGNKSVDVMPGFIIKSKSLPFMKSGEIFMLDYLPQDFKSNLMFYAADFHDDSISELTLVNLKKKLTKNVPTTLIKKLDSEYDDTYMSKRQVLIAKIRELSKYHQQSRINLNLSDEENKIIQSITGE